MSAARAPLERPVPHSLGTARPSRVLPPLACDAHMHVFDPRFPASPHWKRVPPIADVDTYRRLQDRLGTTRAVVVTPSTYGTDNRCTLDALDRLGDDARGVAVVDADVADAELDRLAERRVRGLRVNFVTPQSWGPTTVEMLTTLARKAARLGWHIQVFADARQLVELEPVLARLPTPVVVDHLGLVDPAQATASPAYATLRRLLDSGRAWLKLSGVYMKSRDGEPSYADSAPLGSAFVRAAPERLVWGSDWPHTTQAPESVDDAALLDVLRAWSGSDTVMDRILVENPARLYGFR